MSNFDNYEKVILAAGAVAVNHDEYGFTRRYELTKFGQTVTFEIYKNIVNAYFGLFQVIADEVSIDGCWPNHYKLNLNMLRNGDKVCVIPLEEYPNDQHDSFANTGDTLNA